MTRMALLALSFSLLTTLPMAPVQGAASQDMTAKERYALAEALRLGTDAAPDAGAAFAQMTALAEEGDARAQARLAYYHLKGIGTEIDPTAAAHWYEAAIASGRISARTSYAKMLIRQGDAAAALDHLNIAAQGGHEKAQSLRAAYHYLGRFGTESDAAFGQAELTRFAKAGDLEATRVVLAAMQQGATFDVDAEALFAQVVAAARADDGKAGGKAAEAVLRLRRDARDAETLALRREMVAHPGLRGRARTEDGLMLAYDTHDVRDFRHAAEEIISAADAGSYTRGVYVVSRLDKNAFVYVLQEELRARGYRVGPSTGIFNTRTLNAVTAFCRDQDIQSSCRLGPLRAQVIKVIVAELARTAPQI